jgi:hypothetical protein
MTMLSWLPMQFPSNKQEATKPLVILWPLARMDRNNKNLFYTTPLKLLTLTLSTKENHSRAGALMAVAHRLQSP